jgi:16S rRNA U516 pseudouridylate synthase RsuA-like enzyme
MCELLGLRISDLKRVRIGAVRLGDPPLGQWRFLHPVPEREKLPGPVNRCRL